jgi:hypothetical protein
VPDWNEYSKIFANRERIAVLDPELKYGVPVQLLLA